MNVRLLVVCGRDRKSMGLHRFPDPQRGVTHAGEAGWAPVWETAGGHICDVYLSLEVAWLDSWLQDATVPLVPGGPPAIVQNPVVRFYPHVIVCGAAAHALDDQ
jgi:hypothetical protein